MVDSRALAFKKPSDVIIKCVDHNEDQNKYPETFLGDPAIDFVMLAKSQGIEGEHVNEPGELEAALKRGAAAQAAGDPYLLDVHITNVGLGADSSWYREIGSQI